jgi:hypothetical protein
VRRIALASLALAACGGIHFVPAGANDGALDGPATTDGASGTAAWVATFAGHALVQRDVDAGRDLQLPRRAR